MGLEPFLWSGERVEGVCVVRGLDTGGQKERLHCGC